MKKMTKGVKVLMIIAFALLMMIPSYKVSAAKKETIYVISTIKWKKGNDYSNLKVKYNKKGFITRYDDNGMVDGGSSFEDAKYKYNSKNRIKSVSQDLRMDHSKTKMTYKNGLCVKTTSKSEYFGTTKRTYKYDSKKRLIKSGVSSYEYNEKGQLSGITEDFGNGYTLGKEFEYNDKGMLIKVTSSSSYGTSYTINTKGSKVTSITDSDGIKYTVKMKKISVNKSLKKRILIQQNALLMKYCGGNQWNPSILY